MTTSLSSNAPWVRNSESNRKFKRSLPWIVCWTFCALLAGCPTPKDANQSDFEWHLASPESQGLDASKLAALGESLAQRQTSAFLLVRGDRIIHEQYASQYTSAKRQHLASMAKGIVSGLSLSLALQDQRIQLDEPAAHFIPQWKTDPKRAAITIRQLALHHSGIEDAEADGRPHKELTGWKGAFWRREPDPFSIALEQAPVIAKPGSRYIYSNPAYAALAVAITQSFQTSKTPDIRNLLERRIFQKIQLQTKDWTIGYNETYTLNKLPLVATWGGAKFTPRAIASVGRLLINRGQWQAQTILEPSSIEQMLYPHLPEQAKSNSVTANIGFGWVSNRTGRWKELPKDAFATSGAGDRVLMIIPSLDLIVLRLGSSLETGKQRGGASSWERMQKYIFDPLMGAIRRPPYPPSAHLSQPRFVEKAGITCDAIESDNWPITWGEDSQQYTAYGDGYGFAEPSENKLSLGIARIQGDADNFKGRNIPSPSVERFGDGATGAKASGILMLDHTLYMWVRNLGLSRLAWSEDRGNNWQWGFRWQEAFAAPTFLQFGPNYKDSRDQYVYVYSQDGPSAYEPYDRVIVARVHRRQIQDRNAYEFYAGKNAAGEIQWSHDIRQRSAVFEFPKHCARLDLAYHKASERYLMALGYNLQGGWGIYDAPEPWGPWTTVFHTENWGLGDTHGYRLPTKWMQPNESSMQLVFSGRPFEDQNYDAFCVRRLSLTNAQF